MIRVLFVCHGNICRSPMAEYVFKYLVEQRGVATEFVVDSAATSTEEIGEPVHPGTQRVLRENGIPCGGHRARRIRPDEAANWDYIVVMDDANVRNTRRRVGQDAPVYKLLEFCGETRDVADPWYTGDFETTFDDVMAGCRAFLSFLGR